MSEIPAGAMRFNSDSQKLEYWNGSAWFQVHTRGLITVGSNPPDMVAARGLFGGGYIAPGPSAVTNTIEYVNI